MGKNKFTRIENIPSREKLEAIVPNLTYKYLRIEELPDEFKSYGLISKFNSVIAAASGTTTGVMVFAFNGVRIDHPKIDEHPFLIYFDGNDQTKDFGGIIDHGDWPDRTTYLESWQEEAISASGITASFMYKGIPPQSSGSLYDLDDNGMLEGFKKQMTTLFINKNNDSSKYQR